MKINFTKDFFCFKKYVINFYFSIQSIYMKSFQLFKILFVLQINMEYSQFLKCSMFLFPNQQIFCFSRIVFWLTVDFFLVDHCQSYGDYKENVLVCSIVQLLPLIHSYLIDLLHWPLLTNHLVSRLVYKQPAFFLILLPL